MKLLIAIPALDEEQSIAQVIEASLAARRPIIEQTCVSHVEVTVVSDGSTDRTVEIATRYLDQIKLIVFEHNRGYGAAIKQAWTESDADLLGFMDADGTCDPMFFVELCRQFESGQVDIAVGSRLHVGSRMPLIRRFGNLLFASIVTLFSSHRVRDVASGMRVVRRSCLPRLMPLPDRLHFTPAMSARALMDEDLCLTEVDMPYREREGKSKLAVLRDGLRFLRVIMETALLYQPGRLLAALGFLCAAIAAILMVTPILYYIQNRSVLEWMIYRFVVSDLLGATAVLSLCTSYLSGRIVTLALHGERANRPRRGLDLFFSHPLFWSVPLTLAVLCFLLVWPSIEQLVRTGATYEHWSRFIAMSFLASTAITLLMTRLVSYVLDLIAARLAFQNRQLAALRDGAEVDPLRAKVIGS